MEFLNFAIEELKKARKRTPYLSLCYTSHTSCGREGHARAILLTCAKLPNLAWHRGPKVESIWDAVKMLLALNTPIPELHAHLIYSQFTASLLRNRLHPVKVFAWPT